MNHEAITSRVTRMIEEGTVECPKCNGKGETYIGWCVYERCPACSGTGRVMAPRVVSIPEFDALLGEPLRERKLAHLKDCIAEAEREHSPEEVAEAARILADGRKDR